VVKEPASVSLPLNVKGVEYIPRDRIVFPPESARLPEGAAFKGTQPPTTTATGITKRIDEAGLLLIERNEGFESCPYWDPYGGVWTIGIGEAYVSPDRPCETFSQALANLKRQVGEHFEWPVRDLGVGFNQHQWDALIDFDYNCGPYIFQVFPPLRYALEGHRFYEATQLMLTYDRAGGYVLPALYRRRHEEVALFDTPEPIAETAAQRRVREERELRSDENELGSYTPERGLRGRILVLRHVLLADGCDYRLAHHEKRGLKCIRWRIEGFKDHVRGNYEDGQIAKLRRELA
jgi:lysozyme